MRAIMRIVLLILVLISFSNATGASKYFSKFSRKYSNDAIAKVEKNFISNSKYIDNITSNVNISKLPAISKVALIADGIAMKSPFGKTMLDVGSDPLSVVKYYSKYGDDFIRNTKILNTSIKKINIPALQKKLLPEFPNMKLRVFNTDKQVIDRSIEVMQYTGKKGWEISKKIGKYAAENLKSAVAGVMFAWFLSDPNGFAEALDKAGNNINEFAYLIAEKIGEGAAGVPIAAANGFWEKIKSEANPGNISILMLIVLLYIAWKFRAIIGNIIQRKLAAREDTEKNKNQKKKGRL